MSFLPLRTGAVAALAALVLVACGGLETPFAPVTGRIVGAASGAYAYPLGRPDLKTTPSASDGSFRIEAVPTTVGAFVLFDGTDRAELVPVRVAGGAELRIDDRFGRDAPVGDALKMPLAGAVIAAAVPDGGAVPRDATFTVHETDLTGLHPALGDGIITLSPLPGGRFDLSTALPGFLGRRTAVQVLPGATVSAQFLLPIDPASDAPGCEAASECENGLSCSSADGRCYECTSAADCDTDEACDVSLGLCRPNAGIATAVCEACADDAACASGVCVVESGMAMGYCSRGCAAPADCPAGFACGGDGRCAVPGDCSAWLQTMGSACLDSDHCADDLAGGWCQRTGDAPGLCTAACVADADCRVGNGLAATMVCAPGGWCALP